MDSKLFPHDLGGQFLQVVSKEVNRRAGDRKTAFTYLRRRFQMKFVLLTLCLALPLQALAQDYPLWRDVINSDKYIKTPNASQVEKFASHAVAKSTGPQ